MYLAEKEGLRSDSKVLMKMSRRDRFRQGQIVVFSADEDSNGHRPPRCFLVRFSGSAHRFRILNCYQLNVPQSVGLTPGRLSIL
jgi:hypothetical protein